MADHERIDIEVTDRGADKAADNLRRIADEADRGATFVKRLQSALKSINAGETLKLATAATQHSNALARETAALAKMTTAQANASVATAKAATEQQRLATETARTATAQARAQIAQDGAARSALQLAAATARAAEAKGSLAARANALRSALDPAYAAQMRFNAEINEANALLRGGAISMGVYQQAVAAADARLKAFSTDTIPGLVGGMQKARFQGANVAAQFNDLGVQFAMAAQSGEPLKMIFMALIQQGSQLSYIASTLEGGFGGLLKMIGGVIARFLPIIAIITATGLALNALKNSTPDKEMEDFAKTLGLTKKEMEELKDVSVTWGDTMSAVFDVLAERAGTSTEQIKSSWGSMWKTLGEFAKFSITVLVAAFGAMVKFVASLFINLGKAIVAALAAAFNMALTLFQKLLDGITSGLNWASKKINEVFGTEIGELGNVKLPKIEGTFDFSNPLKDAKDQFWTTVDDMGKGFEKIGQLQEKYAKDRLRKQAKDIIEDRTAKKTPKGKEDHTAERRAHALNMVNMELDREISRMKMLKDERAIQQRMDQIEESLAQKKIKLNDTERASIRAKVTEIERFKYVQAEMDRITEEADEPLRTLNASREAANMLLARGAIDLERYNMEMTKANRAHQEAVDPLFQIKEALTAQENVLGFYNVELEKANFLEAIRLQYLAKGIDLTNQSTPAIRAEIAALVARNDALRQQQYIQSQVAAVVDPIMARERELAGETAFYAELQRLRDNDLISENTYQQARHAAWLKYNEYKLQATADFFGALSQATKHGHGVVGAISKAAAVAEATIQGYLAVQKALASAPPPWNMVAASAVAIQTGLNVAKIISTPVGGYATGGQFIVGGRDGVDKNNINMDVTKGERVTIETVKQQRANDNNRAGEAPHVDARTKVVNYFDEASFLAAIDTEEGERQVMNVIRRNGDGIRALNGA